MVADSAESFSARGLRSARHRVDAEAAGDVESVVERLEADLYAVAGGFGRRHVDVSAEGGAQGVGDQLDRRGLVGMEGRPGPRTVAATGRSVGRSGSRLELADRPAVASGVASQRAAGGVVGGESDGPAGAF